MKIENQVCSLEQGKKLFDLGVHLNSQFAWCWNGACNKEDGSPDFFVNLKGFNEDWPQAYGAFTVAELGVMLLDYTRYIDNPDRRAIWRISYEHVTRTKPEMFYRTGKTLYSNICKTQAVAYASLLIYLLENNHVTTTEVNNRLKNL